MQQDRPDFVRAAEAASQALLAMGRGIVPVDPVPALRAIPGVIVLEWDAAVRQLNARGISPDSILAMGDGVGAVQLIPQDREGQRLTLVMPDQPPARHRFTLAHELGHILLGHEEEGYRQNREANCFASHFLVPRPLLHHHLRAAGRLTPGQLSAMYGVSQQVIQLAVKDTLSLSQPLQDELLRLFISDSASME